MIVEVRMMLNCYRQVPFQSFVCSLLQLDERLRKSYCRYTIWDHQGYYLSIGCSDKRLPIYLVSVVHAGGQPADLLLPSGTLLVAAGMRRISLRHRQDLQAVFALHAMQIQHFLNGGSERHQFT